MFPEDLLAETPGARSPWADATIQQTQEYLEEHWLVNPCHSEYAAPVVLAPEPDGSWRFCVDYRRLNGISGDDKYPIPRMDYCLDQL